MPDVNMPSQGDSQPERKSARTPPDIALCRAKRGAMGDLVYCLMPEWPDCEHAEHFAFDTFCFHPGCEEIVARTKAVRHS
jgi:hypothetical protein